MNIDHIQIEKAIKKAEQKTSGEIVPMVVHSSGSYSQISWSWGFMLAMLLTAVFYSVFPYYPFFIYFIFEIPAMLVSFFIFDIPFIKKYLLHKKLVEKEVFQRAIEAFYRHGLHTAHDRNGILIFISLLERQAQILADTGIHQKISDGTWEKVVSQLTLDIRNHNLTVGFVNAIETCGNILSEHFPHSPEDVNELSDQLLTE